MAETLHAVAWAVRGDIPPEVVLCYTPGEIEAVLLAHANNCGMTRQEVAHSVAIWAELRRLAQCITGRRRCGGCA